MTMGWTSTTVRLLFSAGVAGRGVWWVWWSGTSTLQKGLSYWHMPKVARISSYLSRGWGAWEEGDAVALQTL